MSRGLDRWLGVAWIIVGLALPAFAEAPASGSQEGLDALVGTWNLSGDSPFGTLEHQLVVTADGEATYGSNGEVSDVRGLEIDGEKVRFEMTVYGGPSSYEMSFAGTVDDERLTGEIIGSSGSFATLSAKRE